MAGLLNFKEIPNLLELVEAYPNDLSLLGGHSKSATCGEKSLAELSLCADDVVDGDTAPLLSQDQSVCADEPEPGLEDQSL